nr:hypothetical protein [Ktedonosporobacter rubrisoli]
MHLPSIKLSTAIITTLVALFFTVSPCLPTTRALAQHTSLTSTTTDLASLVDPFTGTGVQPGALLGGGDTFPGADVPFGMVQWSPDTESYTPGGYQYNDNRIKGFSLTHLSGAGCSVYSDIPFMPYVGGVTDSPASNPMKYISTFSHANESAVAGYYKVKLDNGVTTELTATQRSGAGRFTYPAGQAATLIVNTSGSINGVGNAQTNIGENTISGWAASGGFVAPTITTASISGRSSVSPSLRLAPGRTLP